MNLFYELRHCCSLLFCGALPYEFTPSRDSGAAKGKRGAHPIHDPTNAQPRVSSFGKFAMTGNPNGPSLPDWPLYTAQGRAFLEFKGNGSTVATDLRQPYFELHRKDFDLRLGH
jgi:hypothetical protein